MNADAEQMMFDMAEDVMGHWDDDVEEVPREEDEKTTDKGWKDACEGYLANREEITWEEMLRYAQAKKRECEQQLRDFPHVPEREKDPWIKEFERRRDEERMDTRRLLVGGEGTMQQMRVPVPPEVRSTFRIVVQQGPRPAPPPDSEGECRKCGGEMVRGHYRVCPRGNHRHGRRRR